MTDSHLMGADCVHGVPWYECDQCTPMPLGEDEDIAARIADYLETHENFSGMTRREIALEAARLTLQAIREGWERIDDA